MKASGIYGTVLCLGFAFSLWSPLYARHPKMIQVDRSDNGREVTIAVGEIVEISLAENPTTGFRWDLEVKPDPACTLVRSAFEPATGPPGKGGTRRWRFRAVRSGTGEVVLEYRRPWERDAPPRRTFKLSLRVRNAGTTRDPIARSE